MTFKERLLEAAGQANRFPSKEEAAFRHATCSACERVNKQGETEWYCGACKGCQGKRILFTVPTRIFSCPLGKWNFKKPKMLFSVSVIIPSFNERTQLVPTLESVYESLDGLAAEVIVVDDGSTYDIGALPGETIVVRHRARQGIAASRHDGFLHSKGDIPVFLDAHEKWIQGDIRTLCEIAEKRNAWVCPVCESMESKRPVGYASRMVVTKKYEQKPCHLPTSRWLPLKKIGGAVWSVPCVLGGCYAVPRAIYEKVGGWSNTAAFFGFAEEMVAFKSYFLNVPHFLARDIHVQHLFCNAKGKMRKVPPFPVSAGDRWLNCAKCLFETFTEKTFDCVFAPHLTFILGPAVIKRTKVLYREEHDWWMKNRLHTDIECLRDYIEGCEIVETEGNSVTKIVEVEPT